MRLPPLFLRKGDCRERSSWEGMHIQIFGSRFSDFSRHMLYTLTSVAQLCPTLCDPIDCSMPGFPVHHQLLELAQTHVHRVSDAIQPSHPLSPPSPPTFNLCQHQSLSGASSLNWVARASASASVLPMTSLHVHYVFHVLSLIKMISALGP